MGPDAVLTRVQPIGQSSTKLGSRKVLTLCICVLALLTSCGEGRQDQEPIFEGRTLRQWTRALQDPSPKVRTKALLALMELKPQAKPVLPELFIMMRDHPDQQVSTVAEGLIEFIGPTEEMVPGLIELLSHSDLIKRRSAARVLSCVEPGTKGVVPALIKAVKAHSGRDRSDFIIALDRIGPEAREALPLLEELVKTDPESSGRAQQAINRIRSKP